MKDPPGDVTRYDRREVTTTRDPPRCRPPRRSRVTGAPTIASLLEFSRSLVAYCALVAVMVSVTAGAGEGTLRQRLEDLAADNGFAIRGVELIDPGAQVKSTAEGSVLAQVTTLLADYNFVLIQDGKGGVERIVIASRKVPRAALPPRASVQTVRRGRSHFVQAHLSGTRGRSLQVELLVDTGASTLVLPSSMVEALGFSVDELQPGIAQTANGQVRAYLASLDAVRVGAVTARYVSVNFVDDERLGGQRLLGMSFLGRYKLTIDDSQNRILLIEQ